MPLSFARRLARIRPSKIWDTVRAQLALVRARRLVRTRALGQLLDRSEAGPARAQRVASGRVDRLAAAVVRARRHGVVRTSCLERSVALRDLLMSEGVDDARLRVGVRLGDGRFRAHAWIELDGRVLGDRPRLVRSFNEMQALPVKNFS